VRGEDEWLNADLFACNSGLVRGLPFRLLGQKRTPTRMSV
jgi:hypothetical protein